MNLEELQCINNNINIDDYIEFMNTVKNSMNNPEWLGDLKRDDLIYLLSNNSKIWIYYKDNIPICSMMIILVDKNTLKELGINLNYKEVIDYGVMFVNPKCIGNGLQYQMLKELDKYSINLGYKYAIATIDPDNIYSINNILKDNFKYYNTKELKRGIRNIYIKKIN